MEEILQEMLDKLVELIHELGYDVHEWKVVKAEEKAKHYQQ